MIYFSGEAYTVEEGVSDEAFPSENDESIPSCLPPFPVAPGTNKTKGVPDDRNDTGEAPKLPVNFPGDLERFSLVHALPAAADARCADHFHGQRLRGFQAVGCNMCHTDLLYHAVRFHCGVEQRTATLYSDLLVHDMGPGDADNVRKVTLR